MDSQTNFSNNNGLWYKSAVFYELYIRAFNDSSGDGHGDINGVIEKLDYLKDLGVNCIWLLPYYPSPLLDDGYDIADYYNIHEDYGTLEDLKKLIKAAHEKGLYVISDLVLNHTSDQHPWFQKARQDPEHPYHQYYVWSDTKEKFQDARIIFLDVEESNWTWDERAQKYFWHRFYASQPDLNYDSPLLQEEIFKIIKFWLDLGLDGFRMDAVPYLFEREGTNCENLPETHEFLKKVRAFIDKNYSGKLMLSEANQMPWDVVPYFGDGDEMHMAFHFPIMPRIYMSLKEESPRSIIEILEKTPAIPDNCQWSTFLRNHDELTLEMVTEEERQWMWEQYAPEKRMKLNLGIRRRLAPLLDNDRRKIELVNSLLFTLPGSPTLYYGDEIGMGDNIYLEDRNGVRTPMQWDAARKNAGFSEADPAELYAPLIDKEPFRLEEINVKKQAADPDSLLNLIKKMLRIRQENTAFGEGEFIWANDPQAEAVAAFYRTNGNNKVLVLNNLSSKAQVYRTRNESKSVDLFNGKELKNQDGVLQITLQPFAYFWIVLEDH